MFARRVYMHLKPTSVPEFTQRLEKDILPLLRKQKGFQDEITSWVRAAPRHLESVCGTLRKMLRFTTAEHIQRCGSSSTG